MPPSIHGLRLAESFLRRFARKRSALFGALLCLLMATMALAAPLLYPDDPFSLAGEPLLWPGEDPAFPLGTDSLGRDMASALFHGAGVSLAIGLAAAAAAILVGITIGACAGYFGGRVDQACMRFSEIFQTMPPFMFAIVLIAILKPTLPTMILALAGISWPAIARLVRAEFLSLRERDFVKSCIVINMSTIEIIFCQILPNAIGPVIVMATVLVASAILTEAGLSFLGLGDPNVMSWGTMIGLGRDSLRTSWYIAAIPGAAILLAVLGLNLVGEGVNDALNRR
jgi:peptide/nickel transport system permease protein